MLGAEHKTKRKNSASLPMKSTEVRNDENVVIKVHFMT